MSKCEGVKCSEDKICNPETGKCVKKDGRKGKKLVPQRASKCEGVKCSEDKICNPETGKCVKKDGRIGKKLVPPRAASPRAASPRAASPRASPRAASPRASKCEGVKCSEDKICNPETGKCVKKDGRKGKKLVPQRSSCMACNSPTIHGSPFCQYHLDNINDVDINGNTLLHIALQNYRGDENTFNIIEFLIRNGARVDIPDRYGDVALNTILRYAGKYPDINQIMIEIFRKGIVDINYIPVIVAVLSSQLKDADLFNTVRLLLEMGANVNAQDMVFVNHSFIGETALHYILRYFNEILADGFDMAENVREAIFHIVILLLRNGARVDILDSNGDTALYLMASSEDTDLIEMMIGLYQRSGYDINAVDSRGRTVLHYVLTQGLDTDIIDILLRNGARVDIPDMNGNTALHLMASSRNPDIIQIISRLI